MTDSKWTSDSQIFVNPDPIYQDFIDKTGISVIQHYGLMMFGDPTDQTFLREIEIVPYIYSLGDNMSKIAYKEYGDSKLWWVLAWFNGRPTELHCNVGDTINVPHPIDEVLVQVFNRIEL
tara:strand:+ start:194 stop:553 length:360 start_codon:yes stop_codon:yes gene_type:complete